jgi:chromosome segregation ATPase
MIISYRSRHTASSDISNSSLAHNDSTAMEAQAKGYIELMEQRRLTRIAEDEELKRNHEAEQNKIDDEIDEAQQPVFDTDNEIAAVEKAISELRAEQKRQEGKLRDCRHIRTSLAAAAEKERRRLKSEKQRAFEDYNSRIEELKAFRERMDAVDKDKLVARLLEIVKGEVRIELLSRFCSLVNIPSSIRLTSKKLETLVKKPRSHLRGTRILNQ